MGTRADWEGRAGDETGLMDGAVRSRMRALSHLARKCPSLVQSRQNVAAACYRSQPF